jgi:hypothetical protein
VFSGVLFLLGCYSKRCKKIFKIAVFGVRVAARLIEKRIGGRVYGIGKIIKKAKGKSKKQK